jgi:catechol 2,3-dioxygenase-like lactoylglutathione lyase family enzyme
MRIGLTSIYVDDQDQAEQFYTQVLGFQVKASAPYGPGPEERWLTVVAPEDPEGVELLLHLADEPARAFQAAATAGAAAAVAEVEGNLFRREGEYWTVVFDGAVVHLRDAKGLRHLARLLADPGREFHTVDLEAADGQPAPAAPLGSRASGGEPELVARPDLGDAGRCWTPPPRPPTGPGWRNSEPSWRRPRAATTLPAPPRHAKSWSSWSPSWPGRSGWAAGTGGRPPTPNGPG